MDTAHQRPQPACADPFDGGIGDLGSRPVEHRQIQAGYREQDQQEDRKRPEMVDGVKLRANRTVGDRFDLRPQFLQKTQSPSLRIRTCRHAPGSSAKPVT